MSPPLCPEKMRPLASISTPNALPPPSAKTSYRRGLGMIAPDQLAHRVHRLLAGVQARAGHMAGDRRSLSRVEPAVGAPLQAVDHRVRVFQPEALEVDLGVAVGHVVVVAVGIEEQIGRVEHPDAPAPARDRGGDVQAVDKGLVPVEDAVAVGVFMDRDLVLAAEVVGRGRGDLVVDGAPDAVVADHLEPGRERDTADTGPPRAARVRRS